MESVADLTRRIAERLAHIEGVAAVALGGSWSRGNAHPNSDIDIGLCYDPRYSLSITPLRHLARELDDRDLPNLVTDVGGWGPRVGSRRTWAKTRDGAAA